MLKNGKNQKISKYENENKKLKKNLSKTKSDISSSNFATTVDTSFETSFETPLDISLDTSLNKLKMEMINQSYSISNKEALKDKIHEIHNFLRNNGVGYGMNALKVFMLLYGIKKIEDKNLIDKLGLKRPECEFSYLYKLAKEGQDNILTSVVFNPLLDSINESKLNQYLFYEIPKKIHCEVLGHLINEINEMSMIEKTCKVQLSGKIYEYFIGRDKTAISELGAYFTDRPITDFIYYQKLKPTLKSDGTVPSMVDLFAGSGGFTTGFVDYMNKKYSNEIDWDTEIDKIHHYDINEDVIKIAGLETFCLTNSIPNFRQFTVKNSFRDEFIDMEEKEMKFDYIITNPPYGGDNHSNSEKQIKREKVKKYIKNTLKTDLDEETKKRRIIQLKNIENEEKADKRVYDNIKVSLKSCSGRIGRYARINNLNGNDKEACSLILMMELLEKNGTACGVLKQGIFFDNKYKDLRKHLVENFNIREIISVPSNLFENTTVKTSIVIFDNTDQKTEKINFSSFVVDRYEEDKYEEIYGDIILTQSKGDIKKVYDKFVITLTKDEVLNNKKYSLVHKDYIIKELEINEDEYEFVKIGDICESLNGFAFKKNNYSNDGGIPLVTIKHIKNNKINFNYQNDNYIKENEKYNKFIIQKNDIILTLTGKKDEFCSIGLHNSDEKMYLNQRCAILRNFKIINNSYFILLFNSFIGEYINENFGNGTIQYNISLNDILNIKIPIPKTEEKIQEWVDKISKPQNEKLEKEKRRQELQKLVQDKIREIQENEDCEKVKIGELCDFLPKSKRKASYGKKEGIYNFYTSSDKVKKCDKADYEEECLIIGTGGLANIHIDKNFSCSADNFIIKSKYNKYIYNLFKSNMSLLLDGFNGSVLKHLSKTYLKDIKIQIPVNKQLIQDLEPIFEEIDTLQLDIQNCDVLYEKYLQELKEDTLKKDENLDE